MPTADQTGPTPEWREQFAKMPRAEIVALLHAEHVQRQKAEEDVAAWKDERLADPEAQALSRVIRSIDASLPERQRPHGFGNEDRTPQIRRVLRHAAERFGVEWPDPRLPETIEAEAYDEIRQGDRLIVATATGIAHRMAR